MNLPIRFVSYILIASITLVGFQVQSASAQQVVVADTLNTNGDGGGEISDKILIGMGIVVVGILIWLGAKKDFKRMRNAKKYLKDDDVLAHASYTEAEWKRLEEGLSKTLNATP